jgi:hypothetical protein
MVGCLLIAVLEALLGLFPIDTESAAHFDIDSFSMKYE